MSSRITTLSTPKRAASVHRDTPPLRRRTWLAGMLCTMIGTTVGNALAGTRCMPTQMGYVCRHEVNFAQFVQAYSMQNASQWCWAASISMLFAFHGHPVSQTRIVKEGRIQK